eukprot:m.39745 g.39745  ORF g.39745 m.39745 type:complete len:554 (-) comp10308_c0_seq2:265-1926(-)
MSLSSLLLPLVAVLSALPLLLTNAQTNVDITSCVLSLQSPSSSFQLNISPTDLSNKFELSIPQLFNGAYDATVTCHDSSMAPLFSNTFSFTVDGTSGDIIYSNLEESLLTSGAGPSIKYIVIHQSSTATFELLASSPTSSPIAYDVVFYYSDGGSDTVSCSATTSACTGTVPTNGNVAFVTIALDSKVVMTSITSDVETIRTFDSVPSIPLLVSSANELAFGDTALINITVVDNDVTSSNATSSEVIDVVLSMDHVDMSGNVLTSGGGAMCDSSWLNSGTHSYSFASIGYKGRSLQSIPLTPSGSGNARFCRVSVNVTDWTGLTTTSSITINIGTASSSSTQVISLSPVSNLLPMAFAREGTMATLTLYSPDKCDSVYCGDATQCTLAPQCNSADGQCLDPVPTPNVVCDDGDDTTTNETCSTQGVCVGSQKCSVTVCLPLSTCHVAGVCVNTTGECTQSQLKPANAYCDDEDETTVFDTCDAVGVCSGLDVSSLTLSDVMDFSSVAGFDTMRIKTALNALPDVCCNNQVCCEPCTSGMCDTATTYNSLFYVE